MIAVCGSINIDVTAYCRTLPRPGETVHGHRYLTGLGGKGANQAAAAARLGHPTTFIGRVGRDRFAEEALARLGEFAVDLGHVTRDPENLTGIAVINVADGGENAITVVGGANMAVDQTDIDAAADAFARARVLLLQLEIPVAASLAAAARAKAHGATVVLDPAPAAADLPAELFRLVDILTPNESETATLTGIEPEDEASARRAAEALHARGIGIVIVKMGARGAFLSGGRGTRLVPAFAVETVDTVAAGDCFNGGLAYALAAGQPLPDAVRFAGAVGALSTTRLGAASAAPFLPEVERLLAAT
jgi:ribokinase